MKTVALCLVFALLCGCAKNVYMDDGLFLVDRFETIRTSIPAGGCDDIMARLTPAIGGSDDYLSYLNAAASAEDDAGFSLSSLFVNGARYSTFFPIVMSSLYSGNWRKALVDGEAIYANIKREYTGNWWEISDTALTIAQIYVLIGRFSKAEEYLEDADAVLPDKHWATLSKGMVQAKYAFMDVQTGELDKAEARIQAMDAVLDDIGKYGGKPNWINFIFANAHLSKAELFYARGRLGKADEEFRTAIKLFSRTDYGGLYLHYVIAQRASVLAEMGELDQAEMYVREALSNSLDRKRLSPMTGLLLGHLAEILLRKGELDCAEKTAKAGIKTFSLTGGLGSAAVKAKLAALLTRIYAAKGNWRQSVTLFDAAREMMTRAGSADGGPKVSLFMLQVGLDAAHSLIRLGEFGRAVELLDPNIKACAAMGAGGQYEYGQAVCLLAVARNGAGTGAPGEPTFDNGVDTILSADPGMSNSPFFLSDPLMRFIAESYLGSVAKAPRAAQARISRALRLMDLVKSASVAQVVRQAAMRRHYAAPGLQDTLRELQDTELELHALYRAAARLFQSGGTGETQAANRKEREQLEQTRKRLIERIGGQSRSVAEAIDDSALPAPESLKGLGRDEAYLSFFLGEEALYVGILKPGGQLALVATPGSGKTLANGAADLLANIRQHPVTGEPFNTGLAREIHDRLFSGAADALKGKQRLIVCLDQGIGSLPLEALITGGASPGWMINTHSFQYVASLAALADRQTGQPGNGRNGLLAFADPDLDGTDTFNAYRGISVRPTDGGYVPGVFSPLPETRDEVNAIARNGGFAPVQINAGHEATATRYLTADTSAYALIYFATHGVEAGEIPGLHQPALVLTPDAQRREDGLLTLGEILESRLQGQTVVLSACNTASSAGDSPEPYSGLVRAFLYAGARNVVASRWSVDSDATVALMTGVFDGSAPPDAGFASALRSAMASMANSNGAYSHPYYWAPFMAVGVTDSKPATKTAGKP